MLDFDINKTIKKGRKSKIKIYRKYIDWFIRHYYYCDIKCDCKISDSVIFAHNGLGTVINKNAVIYDDVIIQHHVTIGANNDGKTPIIKKGVKIGAGAIIIGGIVIGENSQIGAGSVVLKDVEPNTVVAGVPAKVIRKNN